MIEGLTDVRGLAFVVAATCAAALPALAVLGRRRLAAALGPVRPRTWALAGLLVVAHAALIATVVPAGPWHSFHHDVERWGQVLDTGLPADAAAASMHGPTGFVLLRLALLLRHDPFAANALLSVLATAVGFLAARAILEDDDRALLVSSVHALLPVRLRIASSLQLYVAAELALLVALLATAVHLKDRSDRSFLAAVLALVLASTSHLEMLVVAPLAVASLVLATDPRWFVETLRRPGRLAGLGLLVVLMVPRLLVILTGPAELLPGRPAPGDPKGEVGRMLLLGVFGVLAVLAAVPSPVPRGPWTRRGLGVAAVVAAVPGVRTLLQLAPLPYEGLDRLPLVFLPWRRAHALLSPDLTPAPWATLALVGLLIAWVEQPKVLRMLAPPLLLLTWLHAAHADTISTFVRIAVITAWPFSVAVATALGAAGDLLPARLRPLLVLLPVAALPPHLPWLAWKYPEHHEFEAIRLAREAAARGATVVMPTAADFPPTPPDDVFELDAARGYLRDGVGAGRILGLREALAAGSLPADTVLLWPVGCHEAVAARHDPVGDPHIHILLGDRAWSWLGRVGVREPVKALAGCWSDPSKATCDTPGVEPCLRWRCDVPPPETPPSYTDPMCAAVKAAFPWTTTYEAPLVGPSLTGALLDAHAVVGLYRLGP